jgi:hypothetical protein
MHPPEIRDDTRSNAERHMFDVIRTQLGDDWIALHSLGFAHHRTKPWAEIDFVLLGPQGVFCLEVKGGRIIRQDGRWGFVDRNDVVSWKNEGPFEQVGTAAAALYSHLREALPWIRDSVVAHGVVFPDIEFREMGADLLPQIVYDVHDTKRSFGVFMRRLTSYWYERLEPFRPKPIETLSEAKRSALLDCLRGDFDFRPSLRARIGAAVDELLQLTKEQYRVLDGLVDNDRVVVRGGAGSGKTLLAVEEARRLSSTGQRILLCCYNRRLARHLQKAVADQPLVDVVHLHGLMASVVNEAGLRHRLPPAEEEDLFTVFYPEVAIEGLMTLDRLQAYDVLIVDEAQDLLRDTYIDVFDGLVRHGLSRGVWRFFLDPYQNIYHGIQSNCLRRILELHPAQFRLSINCRNTAPVATAALLLSGIECNDTVKVAGPAVEQQWYRDEAHQRRLVTNTIRRLLSEGVKPSEIVILSRRRLENSCLRDGIPDLPCQLVDVDDIQNYSVEKTVRFSTIASYKGLETEAALLIDINDLVDEDALASVYVGASRAKAYLAVFIDEAQRGAYDVRAFEYGRRLISTPLHQKAEPPPV